MSYGSQVWGPDVFHTKVASEKPYSQWSSAEKVHITHLRLMAGVGNGCLEVLMRDFNRCPISYASLGDTCSAMVHGIAMYVRG